MHERVWHTEHGMDTPWNKIFMTFKYNTIYMLRHDNHDSDNMLIHVEEYNFISFVHH